jgi:hypothetical protein
MVTRMMVVLWLLVGLVGCKHTPTIRTETQKVSIPVLYVPPPPEVQRPAVPDICNNEATDGEIAKCYKAAIILWQGYAKELETIIQGYLEASKSSKELELFIAEKAKELAENPPAE